ncbi:MAG: hypothetical protein JSR57_02860 [Verrucomicrobia bacterium]|nr:hypothetical protein [Verrucomicrobiota bacterium]
MPLALTRINFSQQGDLGPLGLTQEMMEAVQELGEARAIHEGLEKAVHEPGFSQEGFDAAAAMAGKVRELMEKVPVFQDEVFSKRESLGPAAAKILKVQFETLHAQAVDFAQQCSATLASVLEKGRERSEKALSLFQEKVSAYLQGRNPIDLIEARDSARSVGMAFWNVQFLSCHMQVFAGREVEVLDEESSFVMRWRPFNDLVGMHHYHSYRDAWGMEGASLQDALQRLEMAVATNMQACDLEHRADFEGGDLGECSLNREGLDWMIDQLQEEIGSPLVDHWVWKLADAPLEKNYGAVHRYDDLKRLKEALCKSAQVLAGQIVQKDAQGLDLEKIYLKLYEMIGSPAVENPIGWMQKNAYYYIEQLKDAIRQLRLAEHQFLPIEGQGGPARQDGPMVLGPFAQTSVPLKPEPHRYSLVLEQLEKAASAQEELPSQLKREVDLLIGELSQKGLVDTIDYEVWRLSKKPNKEEDHWGSLHRYDDLDILAKALKAAISRDVERNIVSLHFAGKEDRSDFYAQIGVMVVGNKDLPDDFDLEAYGRECLPLNLHLVDSAIEAVQLKIKEKKIDKAQKAVFDAVVEGAIAKEPGADVFAVWIELIKGESDQNECLERVREQIEDPDLDSALRERVFTQIWKEAGEPNIPDFGKNHYLDDLRILQQALFSILVDIAV